MKRPPTTDRRHGASHVLIPSVWTDELIELLTTLWATGQTASRIADQIPGGFSRCAIIGKARRLGLAGRTAASAPSRVTIPKPAPKPRAQARVLGEIKVPLPKPQYIITGNGAVKEKVASRPWVSGYVAAFAPLPGVEPVPFLQRLNHQCRWPVGGVGMEMLCCGAPIDGRSYCPHHADLAVQPVQPRGGVKGLLRQYRRAA